MSKNQEKEKAEVAEVPGVAEVAEDAATADAAAVIFAAAAAQQAKDISLEIAMREEDASDEEIAAFFATRNLKRFESKKGKIEKCDELTKLVAKVKAFGSPIRIVVESNGAMDIEPSKRITFPKSVSVSGNGNGNGFRSLKCVVDGVTYDSMAAACEARGLDHEKKNGRVVLDKAKKDGKITSFVLA